MNNELKDFCRLYEPLINRLIADNQKYYGFNETIKWCFSYDEEIANVASCNRETNVISVNICSVIHAISKNDIKTIEYYLMHEIRHIYQHLVIRDYNEEKVSILDTEIIEKWIYESNHYVRALDLNNKENKDYFYQDSEMDAYAFSYAVMKYKYEDILQLYVPTVYGVDFYNLVDEWIQYFNDEFKKENNDND